jgi:hypothetical protein
VHSELLLQLLLVWSDQREEQLRRARLSVTRHSSEPSGLRRWIGHRLIRVGERLASEPTLRPVRSP